MIWLSGSESPGTKLLRPDVGLMLNPEGGTGLRTDGYFVGCDNGCYAATLKGREFDAMGWYIWLWKMAGRVPRSHRLFAVAPDVVGDAAATWELAEQWFDFVRWAGWPVAVALQDGAEDHAPLWDNAHRYDAVLLGGSVEWKLGEWGYEVAREAQLRGKWVHIGKVNSGTRARPFAGIADSADGNLLTFGPTVNLGRARALLATVAEPEMFPSYVPFTEAEEAHAVAWAEAFRSRST